MPIQADPKKTQVSKRVKLKDTSEQAMFRWWLETDPEKYYQAVWQAAMRIHDNLSARRREHYVYALMYNDIDTNIYNHTQGMGFDRESSFTRITLNVVQNCVDTAASMIARNQPKPLFITDGADYKTYLKADQLTKYTQGIFEDTKIYSIAERVFTDACVYGTGAMKLYADSLSNQIKAEWVFIDEILVDELEGFREQPTQLHQRKYYNRDILVEMFPDQEEAIKRAQTGLMTPTGTRSLADIIPVIESWHLKSGPHAEDGKHSIIIETATLMEEEYEKDYYPIIFWRWYHQTCGFWGRGIAQEIGKIQRTLNKVLRTIDQAQDLVGVPLVVSPKTAMIAEDHLMSNKVGRWVEYIGDTPPQFMTPPSVNPELYQWVETLEQKAYNIVGINQNMAQGQKPNLGPNASGSAIRESTDLASSRFQIIGQRWEDYFTDIARVLVDISKDMYADDPDLAITVQDDSQLKTIKWSDVDMEADKFKIDVFEVSALPSTPAGRLQTIVELSAQGIIPKEMMVSLLNIPDLKRFTNLETSTTDLVQGTIAQIKRDSKYPIDLKPIAEMNLQLAIQLATMEVVLAKVQGVPENVLDLVSKYLNDCKDLLQMQTNPPPQPGSDQGPSQQQPGPQSPSPMGQ
jgi:hypothetical protein